jgi:hypothetical protein
MPAKRHHYLPRFFLERFCRDGLVSVYDRETDEFRRQQPLNTAVIKDYYAFKTEEHDKNLEVEELLSRIESGARPVLQKVDACEELSREDREHLALFVGFLAARVPDFERSFSELVDKAVKLVTQQLFRTPEHTKELLDRYERDTPDAAPIDRDKLQQFIADGEYTVTPHRNYVLATMLQIAMQQSSLIADMDWWVIRAPAKKAFVLSDAPLAIVATSQDMPSWMGVGLLTPGANRAPA